MPSERSSDKSARGWLRRFRLPLALLLAAAAGAGWYAARGDDEPAAIAAAPAAAAAPGRPFFTPVPPGGGLPMPGDRARRRQQLVDNYQLADHTLCSYREGSKYPSASRPIAQNPDQVYPNQPVSEMNPMRLQGGGTDARIMLQTSQSRVYMAAGESVAFSLRAVDAENNVQPLVVTRAVAVGITYGRTRPTPTVPVSFVDDGSGADPVAGDGAFAALLAPGQTGLASFHGTIRTEVRYSAGGRNGVILFDVIYSPELPANWAGPVREVIENGSLVFVLRAEVRQPGRYIVTGRVDDAHGKPFALATFNDVLGPGPNDVRLAVFGKLMRDQDAALPLTLRDVDGYLLRENVDPDRALMPRLEGKVAASKAYPLNRFSDAEWQGEERARYLAEFAKDLQAARTELSSFDPTQPLPPSECDAQGPLR
ncbi:MAG: choice-of-anchor X domain-containing protein [Massilia sp.]